MRSLTRISLLSALALVLLANSAQSATRTWAGNDGTNPSFWDIATTNNWNGGVASFANGDDANFTNAGIGTIVNLQSSVSPNTTIINSTTNAYTFNGGDIATGSVAVSGSQTPLFTQNSLSFAGGTTVDNLRVDFKPTSAGSHSFGSGPITLNNGASTWFNYDPSTTGSTLTNDFIVNGTVTWRNAGSVTTPAGERPANPTAGITRSGDIYLNGTLQLAQGDDSGLANCAGNGCLQGTNLREHVILTGNRTIFGGERFYTTATTISGDITSQGGPHDLTLSHRGDNSDWELFVSATNATDPNGWDVKNIRRTSFSNGNGTVVFRVDETQFFNNMTANGGSLFITGGGVRFHDEFEGNGNSLTANINFAMVLDTSPMSGNGTGIRRNTIFNVNNGGKLSGNGIYRSGTEAGGAFTNALDINVFAGGEIAPGNPEVNNGVGQMTIQGDLTFVNGGQLTIQVDGTAVAGTDYDQLLVTVAPGAGGGGVVSGLQNAELVIDFDPSVTFAELAGTTLTILSSASLLSSEFLSVSDNFNSGIGTFSYDVLFQGNQILLTNFQLSIPEPNSLLLLVGMLGCCLKRRRKV